MVSWYKEVLGNDFVLIIPIREPVARYISWYQFYIQRNNCTFLEYSCKKEWELFENWVESGQEANGFAKEFGIRTLAELENVVNLLSALNVVTVPMTSFEPALRVVAERLHMDHLDRVYIPLNAFGSRYFVSEYLLRKIRMLTKLDRMLYRRLMKFCRHNKVTTVELKQQFDFQMALTNSCAEVKSWYSLYDTEYEGLIGSSGKVLIPSRCSHQEMLSHYNNDTSEFC